ncbi:MAG TPA: SCP2 sterol-binding domain-containing protein [Thermoplasmata archaeon]|nr:SCP2 sterol-binding domain-containing protein [Thermoplasmata archaeon]
MLERLITEAIGKFNAKSAEDPALARELEGIRKTVQIEVEDGDWYHFALENGSVGALLHGSIENPDIRVIASTETLTKLWTNELRVMKAFVSKRLQVKGSIEDLLRLKKFF